MLVYIIIILFKYAGVYVLNYLSCNVSTCINIKENITLITLYVYNRMTLNLSLFKEPEYILHFVKH